MKKNIRKQFTGLLILAGLVFLMLGILLVGEIFSSQREHAVEMQKEVGKRAVNEFTILTHEIADTLIMVTKLADLLDLPHAEQENLLSKIRSHKDQRHNDIMEELVLLNNQGRIVAFASRTSLFSVPMYYPWSPLRDYFSSPAPGETYYGPVQRDEYGMPFMIFAVPLVNYQTGEIKGALAARIRIAQVWEELVHKPVGLHGFIYITDGEGRVLSHPGPAKGLMERESIRSSANHPLSWLRGDATLRAVQKVAIGSQTFFIVIERPVAEALALTIHVVFLLLIFVVLFLGAGVASGIVFTRKIIKPIESLACTAQQIKDGDLSCVAQVESQNELGLLATSFNGMIGQLTQDIEQLKRSEDALRESEAGLEAKVAERTSALQHLLECSNILASSRDLHILYRQAVEFGKTLLELDFATIMLLSEDQKTLVVQDTLGFPQSSIGAVSSVEGQGFATYVMKERQPVTVINFNTESRFQVPWIVEAEHITSALCIPMVIGEEVLGVFLGYTCKERHFHDAEVVLGQSFVNQVAVALDNAGHFQHLQRSELKFKELFDNTNDAILVYDLQGQLLEVNRVACERLDYTREELLHLPPGELIAPQFAVHLQDRIRSVAENKKEIFESSHVTRSGVAIPIELSCTLFEYEGQPAILGVARDISERRKMEEELLKNRKLESVGVLAGGIAHDFNNILAAIIGNINLATIQVASGDTSTQDLLLSAEKAALRAKNLTKQLLTFSKGGEPVKAIASIAEVIAESTDFILRGKNIKGVYHFPDELWPVSIDAGQISQVIQNIVMNGCDVMGDGGSITIRCENIDAHESRNLPVGPGDYVKISIQDEGPGIPPRQLKRIFDPYFTTKKAGSGLGLAITHSIINKHGGVIRADSPQGGGAVFTIYLKAARYGTVAQEDRVDLVLNRGKGTVMVMDDDAMIREVSSGLLSSLGYEVLLVEDGQEAINLYKKRGSAEKIDVIIMDLTIPGGMGGEIAVQEIHRLNPEAKVIVSSGYSNNPIMANYAAYGFCAALDKPYQLKSLMMVMDQVLA